MIKYNLVEPRYRNHPDDYKYGTVVDGSVYNGYTLTVVDNSKERVNGYSTGEYTLCLLHLSERVRFCVDMLANKEFLYVGFSFGEYTYRMFDYSKIDLSRSDVIDDLLTVIYKLQPFLQEMSLVGNPRGLTGEDVNYYQGKYVLNDGCVYSILKYKNKYKFYKGEKNFNSHWGSEDGLLFEGVLDEDLYSLAVELERLRHHVVVNANKMLDNLEDSSVSDYRNLMRELDIQLETLK